MFAELSQTLVKTKSSVVCSHALEDFALDRAVSIGLSIEVLGSVANAVAGIAGNGDSQGGGCSWTANWGLGNYSWTGRCKLVVSGGATIVSCNKRLLETIWDFLDLSSGGIICVQLLYSRSQCIKVEKGVFSMINTNSSGLVGRLETLISDSGNLIIDVASRNFESLKPIKSLNLL